MKLISVMIFRIRVMRMYTSTAHSSFSGAICVIADDGTLMQSLIIMRAVFARSWLVLILVVVSQVTALPEVIRVGKSGDGEKETGRFKSGVTASKSREMIVA